MLVKDVLLLVLFYYYSIDVIVNVSLKIINVFYVTTYDFYY